MNEVREILIHGDGHAARRRLGSLIAHEPEKTRAVADVIANILWTSYHDQFCIGAVHDFCENMELELPGVITERVAQSLGGRMQRTGEWGQTLYGLTQERLVRECRALIVRKDLKGAAERAVALLERVTDDDKLDDACNYLARGLAGLVRDHQRALTVIGMLMKTGGRIGMAAALLADHFNRMTREMTTTQFDSGDRDWLRNQTDAILSLRSFLPGPNEVGEPEETQLETFHNELHAILRAGLIKKDRESFIDALIILMEFCPTDPTAIRNVAGVEDRMFVRLSPRGKLVAVRTLGQLGALEFLRRAVLGLVREAEKDPVRRRRMLTAIMGGLRHPDFFPALAHMLAKAETEQDEELAIEALGRIGNPEAIKLLLDRLAHIVKKLHDPVHERRARRLLTAFGRIGRARDFDHAVRNAMIEHVIRLIDVGDRKLTFQTAFELFSVRREELRTDLKAWAVRKAIDAMWGKTADRVESFTGVNGWREPMVAILRGFGPEFLPVVLDQAAKYATRYGGAMTALGNVLQDIGDKRALPLLESMLRCAFLYQEDQKQANLFKETALDAASGEVRDLNRDDLIHTLLYTLVQIGEEPGLKLVLDFADQIQVGRLESPGQQTINFVVDLKLKHGRLATQTQAADTMSTLSEKELKSALSEARGGLLTKKVTRIAAMATLGQARRPESIAVLVDALGEKDSLVASAAHTALTQFIHPLPGEQEFKEFLDRMLERPAVLKGRVMDRLQEFIRQEIPKNAPYDRIFDRQVEIALEDGALIHQVRAAMAKGATRGKPASDAELESIESGAPGLGQNGHRGESVLTELDKKRAYLQARRDWIATGKTGEPPTPPS